MGQSTSNTRKVVIFTIVAAVSLIIPIAFYICYFYRYPIADDTAKWGTFGDYIGGTLNPIISFLTLVITIVIAVELSKLDTIRSNEAISFEKRRFLNELRETEYKRIVAELQRVPYLALDGASRGKEIVIIYANFSFFLNFNRHLFHFLDEDFCKEFQSCLLNTSNSYTKNDNSLTAEELKEVVQKYTMELILFTRKFQEYIIAEMN